MGLVPIIPETHSFPKRQKKPAQGERKKRHKALLLMGLVPIIPETHSFPKRQKKPAQGERKKKA